VLKNLRLKSFQPEEEYVYLTYSIKNDKKKESKILLENYRVLLQKVLDWLWNGIKIERKEVKKGKKTFTKVKITLPKKKGVYKKLRNELERINVLASHYVDKVINDAYSILESWKRRASLKKPTLKKVYVRIKSTLRNVKGESVRITVKPYQYLSFHGLTLGFHGRLKGLNSVSP